MTGLDPHFLCMSPESADPDTIPLRLLIEEVSRELHRRRDGYPRRVAKGSMTPYDAEHQIGGFALLLDDLRAQEAQALWAKNPDDVDLWQDLCRKDDHVQDQLKHFHWSQLVTILRREITMRRKYYPDWVRGGTLDAGTARHQLERLEAVHFQYWCRWRHFWPDHLYGKESAMRAPGPEREAFHDAFREHRARFDPTGTRGEYINAPAEIHQAELALA